MTEKSPYRYRHFHLPENENFPGVLRKGPLAGSLVTIATSYSDNLMMIGFVVANPADKLTRKEGRDRAMEALHHSPVTVTRENFLDMVKDGTLFKFLCRCTHKSVKICHRLAI